MILVDILFSTSLILIFFSGAYCLWEHTKIEQKAWEKRKRERERINKKMP